jgi:glycosyltransferase involved in cell wall biosynthesis
MRFAAPSACRLKISMQPSERQVHIHMVGDGLDEARLRERASTESLTNVEFHGRQSMSRASAMVVASDAALVHLSYDPLFRITIPSKTQGYLHLGAPIVMGASGDPAALVESAGAGFVAPPEDDEALAAVLCRMAELSRDERRAMGEAGREYYARELSVDAGLDTYESVFACVLA